MTLELVAQRLEAFVRTQFQVAADDPHFSRSVPLFDAGYIDSVGVVELLEFIAEAFRVDLPDAALGSPAFSTINGIAGIVAEFASRQGVTWP